MMMVMAMMMAVACWSRAQASSAIIHDAISTPLIYPWARINEPTHLVGQVSDLPYVL